MNQKSYRSLFWPVLLIGVGVIWLLSNLGVIPRENLAMLVNLWPLILIIIGLDLLFGRQSPLAGVLIGVITVGMAVVVLIAGPALGLAAGGVLRHESIREPLGEAARAEIILNLSTHPARIYGLSNSSQLLEAEIDYFGELRYTSSGERLRRIRLEQFQSNPSVTFSVDPTARWDIGLTSSIPLELTIDGSSGSAEFDLSSLQLANLEIDQSSGRMEIQLPAGIEPYTARIDGGSGSLQITLPDKGNLTLRLEGSSGSIQILTGGEIPLRLEIRDDGSGSVNLPAWLNRISGRDKEGVWESASYSSAANPIVIICEDLGSGSFTIR
ncbi:MAG: LiaI-LiaF-like domain-containing protein [Bellilinea sp.]